jgi:hypothetical protein
MPGNDTVLYKGSNMLMQCTQQMSDTLSVVFPSMVVFISILAVGFKLHSLFSSALPVFHRRFLSYIKQTIN